MDIMHVLEETALEFSSKRDIEFVEFMLDRHFAISAIDNEFVLSNEAKNILLQRYLERRYA